MGFDNVNVNVCGGQSIIKALQNYNTVILKPNIVDNRNVLTQEMMSEKHTKYIIRWNYSLEGATINVPEDCIIEFAGGTIDNGTIVGNNTMLMYSKPIDEVCLAERQGTFIYNTTVADEEDITSESGQLKFKDRPTTDGMGRKILRKNIVDGVNTLTQSMIQATNTIYVIQYDFILEEDVTIPANCILEFDGGSISASGNNNVIESNNTISKGLYSRSQISGIRITNGFTTEEYGKNVRPLYAFGDYTAFPDLIFPNALTTFSGTILVTEDISLGSTGSLEINNISSVNVTCIGDVSIILTNDLHLHNASDVTFDKCRFMWANTDNNNYELYVYDSSDVKIVNSTFRGNFNGTSWKSGGIHLRRALKTIIESNTFDFCHWDAILVHNTSDDIIIKKNIIRNCTNIGIEVEGRIGGLGDTELAVCSNVVIEGNVIEGCIDVGICVNWSDNIVVSGNIIKSCKKGINVLSCMNVNVIGNIVTDAIYTCLTVWSEFFNNINKSCGGINICNNKFKGGTFNSLVDVYPSYCGGGIIYLKNANSVSVKDNSLEYTSNYDDSAYENRAGGLVVDSCLNVDIDGNTIEGKDTENYSGILVFRGYLVNETGIGGLGNIPTNIIIKNNTLTSFKNGIASVSDFDNVIVDNQNNVAYYVVISENCWFNLNTDVNGMGRATLYVGVNNTYSGVTNHNLLYSGPFSMKPQLNIKTPFVYFDETNKRPIFWNCDDNTWRDATGTQVN